jgi:peroxiredoxin
MSLSTGQDAPDFSLESTLDKKVSLADFRGKKHVVLAFYPLDFSPTCSMQLPEYSANRKSIEALGAVILGVNRDSVYTHKAWAREFGIDIPLLADMTNEVARAYGVYSEGTGKNGRAVFIIDKGGKLRHQHVEKQSGDFTMHASDILGRL